MLRVSKHFPRTKGCVPEAKALFTCLDEHGTQTPEQILAGGATGEELAKSANVACQKLMKSYDSCMEKALKKYPQRIERVSEAYRRDYNQSQQ